MQNLKCGWKVEKEPIYVLFIVCERIFGEELKEEETEKKYFCNKCLDLLNKRKDEVKRNIWAKIAVIQKKNSEAVEAIQVIKQQKNTIF